MTDNISDVEQSATSLNRKSWSGLTQDEQPHDRPGDNTPLLRKQGGKDLGAAGARARGAQPVGQESSASYSTMLAPNSDKQGLYVTKTVFGEVLV